MENYIVKELFHYCNVKSPQCDYYARKKVDYYTLAFALEGCITYVVDGNEYILNKNYAIFIKPGMTRERLENPQPIQFLNFNFEVCDGIELPLPLSVPLPNNFISDIKKLTQIFPYIHILSDSFSKQKISNLLNFILLELLEKNSRKSQNAYVNEIIKIVDERITEKLTLHDISTKLNLSKEYVSYIFKKETGTTLTSYINEQKMIVANEFVVNSDMPLTEIGQILGFENYNYFSRLFKKHFDQTPISMRKTI